MYDEFEHLFLECKGAVERFVNFRLSNHTDAEDILQEVYMTAYQKFTSLRNKKCFKSWILCIARNKCNDYFRNKIKVEEISLDSIGENFLQKGRCGITQNTLVRSTMEEMQKKHRDILSLYYFYGFSQAEIAEKMKIPTGTVKSRLYHARKEFKDKYPNLYLKGEVKMGKLPKVLPEYTITRMEKDVFPLKWEELMGWFIVPREGEKISWGMYDSPAKTLTEYVEMEVTGKAEVHGIEGVEIRAVEYNSAESNREGGEKLAERYFVAQLTDIHCRFLAESHMRNGVRKCFTFLDGDEFLSNWGFGEDNCGNEIQICPKGDIVRKGNEIQSKIKEYLLDVVGRYEVTLAGKTYDTLCVVDIETYNSGVMSEQYLDKNGRTVLWRRFNCDDWAYERYGKKWSEQLPDNERVLVNGQLYVHWYDCITDLIV